MPDRPPRRPEGDLIARELKRRHLSARQLAPEVGITEARLRQIINGFQSAGAGQRIAVTAPALTLARIAKALQITAEQLTEVGRADAATELADLAAGSTAEPLADLSDAAVAEVMRRPDIDDRHKRALVELLIDARRADEQRRLQLARDLLALWHQAS